MEKAASQNRASMVIMLIFRSRISLKITEREKIYFLFKEKSSKIIKQS